MKTKKKISIIAITSLIVIIAGCIIGYFGYGSTMINPDNEQSIINFLSTDKDKPIEILATKKYEDRFLILYIDPIKVVENKNSYCFSTFVKNKYYRSRYNASSLSTGDGTEIQVSSTELEDMYSEKDTRAFAIANVASEETKCSVFEVNIETFRYESRLDVIDVPQNQPYIIVKEYKLKNKDNIIVAFDGDVSLNHLNAEYWYENF